MPQIQIGYSVCACLDLLGFSAAIDAADLAGPKAVLDLAASFLDSKSLSRALTETIAKDPTTAKQHWFSDTLILVTDPIPKVQEFDLAYRIVTVAVQATAAQVQSVLHGLPMRGGISHGLMSTGIDLILGKPLIEAHLLEREGVSHPAIALSKKSELALRSLWASKEDIEAELRNQHQLFVYTENGQLILNPFWGAFSVLKKQGIDSIASAVERAIFNGLQKHESNERIYKKWAFLRDQFNFYILSSGTTTNHFLAVPYGEKPHLFCSLLDACKKITDDTAKSMGQPQISP